jgi:hypothetical protein
MSRNIFMGEFNSEKYWRDEEFSKLPEITDNNSNNIIYAMDELLFPFLNENDILLTRFRFDKHLKDYLRHIGFKFLCNIRSIQEKEGNLEDNIFKMLCEKSKLFKEVIPYNIEDAELSTYSVIPFCEDFAKSLKLKYEESSYEIVKMVNSKVYSQELCKRLGFKYTGDVVKSSEELLLNSKAVNEGNDFIIKDPYGVSGKGNMLINSQGLLRRIAKHLKRQEEKGLKTLFVVEPFLQKEIDFSCGFNLDATGKLTIISIQKMINSNFAYSGSCSAEKEFVDFLYQNGYFSIIEAIGKTMHEDGYFGDVCVDSMVLKNGEIVPVIEINARKSMGFINNHIDKYLKKYSLKGSLCFLNVGYRSSLNFNELFNALEKEKLIFYSESENGLIPLSSNTLFINKELDDLQNEDKIYKGRFYMSVVSKNIAEKVRILNQVRGVLKDLSVQVYN